MSDFVCCLIAFSVKQTILSRAHGEHLANQYIVSSPDLIRRVYRFQILKAISTGIGFVVGFGSGTETNQYNTCSSTASVVPQVEKAG